MLNVAKDGKLDPATVAAWYAQHAAPLRHFLTGLVRDSNLAADLVQTTFAKAAEAGHEVEPENCRAWLFRVAYNEAMAARRRQGVDNRARQQVAWLAPSADPAADALAQRGETVQQVRQALERLPQQQAVIVRMRIYENKTFATIADELGIPLGTALGRMRSALKSLRAALAPEAED